MRVFNELIFALSLFAPAVHAALVRHQPSQVLEYDDPNENFVLPNLAASGPEVERLAARIGAGLVLPASLVQSIAAVHLSEAEPNPATLTAMDLLIASDRGALVRGLIARTVLAVSTEHPDPFEVLKTEVQVAKFPERYLALFRALKNASGYTRNLRPGARVQLFIGEPGAVGKSVIVDNLVGESGRRVSGVSSHMTVEGLIHQLNRAVGERDDSILVVDTWWRLTSADRQLLLFLLHHRELLGNSQILIVEDLVDPPLAGHESELTSALVPYADGVHVIRRPSRQAYAQIIGDFALPGLDADSRWAKIIALEAFEYQELIGRSALRDLRMILGEKGVDCEAQLFTPSDGSAVAGARLVNVVREYFEGTKRRY